MRNFGVRASLLLGLLLAGCHKKTNEAKKLGNNPVDRESYSLGYQLGTSLKTQKTSINDDAYIAGLNEGLTGATSQVSADELRGALGAGSARKPARVERGGGGERGERGERGAAPTASDPAGRARRAKLRPRARRAPAGGGAA